MRQEFDLATIMFLVRKYIGWLFVSAMTGAVIMFCISTFAISPTYKASMSLYVNSPMKEQGASGDINLQIKLVNNYIEVLKSRDVLIATSKEMGGRISEGALRGAISLSSNSNTSIIGVTVTANDAATAYEIVNAFKKAAPDATKSIIDEGSFLSVFSVSDIPKSPSSPNVRDNSIIGGVAGGVLCMGLVILLYILDNTVKDEESLKTVLDVPVLGEIPSMSKKSKSKK